MFRAEFGAFYLIDNIILRQGEIFFCCCSEIKLSSGMISFHSCDCFLITVPLGTISLCEIYYLTSANPHISKMFRRKEKQVVSRTVSCAFGM